MYTFHSNGINNKLSKSIYQDDAPTISQSDLYPTYRLHNGARVNAALLTDWVCGSLLLGICTVCIAPSIFNPLVLCSGIGFRLGRNRL